MIEGSDSYVTPHIQKDLEENGSNSKFFFGWKPRNIVKKARHYIRRKHWNQNDLDYLIAELKKIEPDETWWLNGCV